MQQNGGYPNDQQFIAHPTLNANEPIQIQPWPQRGLGSLREEKSYEYAQKKIPQSSNNNNNKDNNNMARNNDSEFLNENEQKSHRSQDTMFRLNTKRMSYKGFEFGDFGFMTTDFDQLSRGHTQLS